MSRRTRWLSWAALVPCLLFAGIWVHRWLLTAGVFLRLEKASEPGWLVHYGEREIRVRESADGRAYLPTPADQRPILLVHGMHEEGIDDPRMIGFARALAGAGFPVSTPRMDKLAHYQLDAAEIPRIAQAARALASEVHQPVLVFGISFGGGLAIRASCNHVPEIARVVALGAHHDAVRVSRFYLDQPALDPAGQRALVEPHPYGRLALRIWLGDARSQAPFVAQERARVEQLITAKRDALRAASPVSCPDPAHIPALYLAHGSGDRVVPYTETLWNEHTFAPARTLISPAIVHAEYAPPTFRERLALISFMVAALW